MKKSVLTIILVSMISVIVSAQNREDQTAILKKCIDLPDIQKYFPLDGNGNPQQVILIERHPSMLMTNLPVKKFGMDLKIIYESGIQAIDPDVYVMFNDFEITEISGNVSYEIHFSDRLSKRTITVSLSFSKENQEWNVIGKSIK